VLAPAGRYLWVQLELRGTDQATPKVRAVRVERPGHRLLNSLPRAWSRAEEEAGFLQRFLAPAEGVLHELDWRSAKRAVLLDSRATPADKLDWLASFAGLVLDHRWPEPARRRLVAEAYPLFARRGTKAALVRLLELYLGRPPTLVEQWQLRGLGGAVLDLEPTGPPAPVVGGSARATGSLGRFILGGRRPDSDAYRESAHRCTVMIPGRLTDEQRDVVFGLLEVHRPAHVEIGLCELGDGMRVGVRLRVSLTSFVGPGGGWQPLVVGQGGLGTDGVVSRAVVGARVGENRVGRVRVG
jgi:phage tail-like protein